MGSCLILVEMLIPSIRLVDDLNVKSLRIPIALILLESFPKAVRLRGVTGFNKKNRLNTDSLDTLDGMTVVSFLFWSYYN